MSTVNGRNFQKSQNVPSDKVDVTEWFGRVRCVSDLWDIAVDGAGTTLALNTVIKMGKLPKGAKVVEAVLAFDDLGTVGVLDVGLSYPGSDGTNDDNAFLASVDVHSAADTVSMSDQNNMVGFGLTTESEADIEIKVSTATDAVTGKIKLSVFYTLD